MKGGYWRKLYLARVEMMTEEGTCEEEQDENKEEKEEGHEQQQANCTQE